MQIEAIKAFSDNYIWLLHDANKAWVVDPGDAQPVIAALAAKGLELEGIIITHHHFDHTGGVQQLRDQYPQLVIPGPKSAHFANITKTMRAGESIEVLGCNFSVIEVPGHTLDHIAYYCSASPIGEVLLCGDTLFAGGCGRVFEGTAPMMRASLNKLASLPAATKVYCAHEYTLANLAFAAAVEPRNEALSQRIKHCQQLRQDDKSTVPSTINDELTTNPFLRSAEPAVISAAQAKNPDCSNDEDDVFTEIRHWKNNF
ncbi:MAG: hydroxyacylglutathione hydrolase [Chitinophagales bacterium]|jgi:hydroxyacylglutathione hydrolase